MSSPPPSLTGDTYSDPGSDPVLARLLEIQRLIADRFSTVTVLDSIVTAAAELIGSTIMGLRLMEASGDSAALVAVVGADGVLERTNQSIRVGEGVAGIALAENRFVVADDSDQTSGVTSDWLELGVTSMMAAPIRRNGEAVGSLAALTWIEARRFTPVEQQILQTLAELGSLALNDASAVEQVQRSLDQAQFDSEHDPLTGLTNRARAIEFLMTPRVDQDDVTAVVIDIDRFQSINEEYGHTTGDEILRIVAHRLGEATRVDDLVARLSSDEFLAVVSAPDEQTAAELAQRIADELCFTATVGFREIELTASVGCARHLPGETADEVVNNASLAMTEAKNQGGGRLIRYDGALREARRAELELVRRIRAAIVEREFVAFFQPIVDLRTGKVIGAEALARWIHDGEVRSPAVFVDAAERCGVIDAIDDAVLHSALSALSQWRGAGLVDEAFRLSVNVSAGRFQDLALVESVSAGLAAVSEASPDAGAPDSGTNEMPDLARQLWLEITETAMMHNVSSSKATMHELRALGVHLAVDDFGTGWSSLAYLTQFPVEALKVDREFVVNLHRSTDDRAVVMATLQLAKALGLIVVAEGIEEPDQLELLIELGCRTGQGFLFGPPVAGELFVERWLSQRP